MRSRLLAERRDRSKPDRTQMPLPKGPFWTCYLHIYNIYNHKLSPLDDVSSSSYSISAQQAFSKDATQRC